MQKRCKEILNINQFLQYSKLEGGRSFLTKRSVGTNFDLRDPWTEDTARKEENHTKYSNRRLRNNVWHRTHKTRILLEIHQRNKSQNQPIKGLPKLGSLSVTRNPKIFYAEIVKRGNQHKTFSAPAKQHRDQPSIYTQVYETQSSSSYHSSKLPTKL